MPLVNVKLIEGVFGDDAEARDDREAHRHDGRDRGGEHARRDLGRRRRGQERRLGHRRPGPHDRGRARPRPRARRRSRDRRGHRRARPRGRSLPTERGFADVGGVRIAYEVFGEGERDDPAAAAVGDRPLALLEAAGPVPRPPLPRRHLRPARQRPLRPARDAPTSTARARRRRTRSPCSTRPASPTRVVVATARPPAPRCCSPSSTPSASRGAVFMSPALPITPRAARAHRALLRRRAARVRGLGQGQPPLLGARLPRLPRVLLRPLLHRAALDQAVRGLDRAGRSRRRRRRSR